MLLPALADRITRLPPDVQLRSSSKSFWSMVALASWVSEGWSLGYFLRLHLPDHILLHLLLAARVVRSTATTLCKAHYLKVSPPKPKRVLALSPVNIALLYSPPSGPHSLT